MASLLPACALGLGLGLRHALEADHVAAIGTMLARGHGVRRAAGLGAAWGLGHATAVLGAGLALLALDIRVPSALAVALDLGVAAMLLALGARSLLAPASGPRRPAPARSPAAAALVGLVHGASGTAALTLLVFTTFPSRLVGAGFLAVFAAGATLGMTLLSALVAMPLRAALERSSRVARFAPLAAGVTSIAAAALVVLGVVRDWGG